MTVAWRAQITGHEIANNRPSTAPLNLSEIAPNAIVGDRQSLQLPPSVELLDGKNAGKLANMRDRLFLVLRASMMSAVSRCVCIDDRASPSGRFQHADGRFGAT
jgi:hypothetical protein